MHINNNFTFCNQVINLFLTKDVNINNICFLRFIQVKKKVIIAEKRYNLLKLIIYFFFLQCRYFYISRERSIFLMKSVLFIVSFHLIVRSTHNSECYNSIVLNTTKNSNATFVINFYNYSYFDMVHMLSRQL